MTTTHTRMMTGWLVLMLAAAAHAAPVVTTKIGSVARFQGEFPNKILGQGLVVGLAGTGDGGEYMPAMRPLRELLARFANPVAFGEELKDAKNVAIVLVEATLPQNGVREGDRIDVQISSVGAAKNLAGGRLVMTPLLAAGDLTSRADAGSAEPRVLAFASGPLVVNDPKGARTAMIPAGATIEYSIIHNYISLGGELEHYQRALQSNELTTQALCEWVRPAESYVTLVLHESHASWAMASIVAQMINDDSIDPDMQGRSFGVDDAIAMAADRNNVLVRIPEAARRNPAPFLARIETLDLILPPSEARVIVNRRTGSVIITGDVQISPVVITFKGMTITTVMPEPKPTVESPSIEEQQFAALDPADRGGTKLKDLVEALNRLKIPAADRVHIIEQLHRMGKLHAKLIVED
ncbi:MAG: flagellar basal body P-ring protein FlgI [Phycisphaerae bacterium]|nr:flagellar basal body P-ring protein FlgI [Phycisphaerae bacterium]